MLQTNDSAPTIPNHPYTDWTLVYFYPKDFTPGCTTEACAFRDSFTDLSKKVKIIGISSDSVEYHEKFKNEYHLPFDLVSDPDKILINAFGANGLIFPKRVSFLINPEGKVAKVYPKVDVVSHVTQILADIPSFV